MITALHLENYGSFVDVDWDLTTRHEPKHVVALYGENGAGKTNLLKPFAQLARTIVTLRFARELMEKLSEDSETLEANQLQKPPVGALGTATTLAQVFRNAFTINSHEDSVIRIAFENSELKGTGNSTGYYELVFDSDHHLKREALYSIVNVRNGMIFDIHRQEENIEVMLNTTAFSDEALNADFRNSIQRLWGKHTFLSIIDLALRDNNREYMRHGVTKSVWHAMREIQCISFTLEDTRKGYTHGLLTTAPRVGRIERQDEAQLDVIEQMLNAFFPQLYSDIVGLRYVRQYQEEMVSYRLIVQKNIWGEVRDIPFELESDGTKRLLDMMPMIADAMHGNTVVIDEIDTGIHDLLMLKLVEALDKQIKGQLIFSTHNTLLLNALRPESAYVIQEDTDGFKYVANFPDIKTIKKNNNVQKMYLNGDFMGIPYTGFLDLDEVFDGQQK